MTTEPHLIGIVDDDSSVRTALGSLVRSLGYRAMLFASAEEFREGKTDDFDCLVCDINMPGMSGWELLAWIRVNGPAVPMIMITAFGDTDASGPADPEVKVFTKPFDGDQIAVAIRQVIAACD